MSLETAAISYLQFHSLYQNNTHTSLSKYNNYTCLSPNNKIALCLSLFICPPLLRIHLNSPINDDNLAFLEASKCEHGFGAEPFVCCSVETEFIQRGCGTTAATSLTTKSTKTSLRMTFKTTLTPRRKFDTTTSTTAKSSKKTRGTSTTTTQKPFSRTVLATPSDCSVLCCNIFDMQAYHSFALIRTFVYTNNWRHDCVGSLIGPRYILTSALCAIQYPPKLVRLGNYIGKPEINYAVSDFRVEETIIHPGWYARERCFQDDIALIRLSREVTYNNEIAPICLPSIVSVEVAYTDNGPGIICARGLDSQNNEMRYFVEHATPLRENKCSHWLGRSQVCVEANFIYHYAQMNVGGPYAGNYTNHWVITGVASRGYNDMTNIFVKVSSYEDWIRANVRP